MERQLNKAENSAHAAIRSDRRIAKRHYERLEKSLRQDFCDYLVVCRDRLRFNEIKSELARTIIGTTELMTEQTMARDGKRPDERQGE
jgi:hypothetical protein